MTEKENKTISERKAMLLATLPPITIAIIIALLSYKPGTELAVWDWSVMTSLANVFSSLTMLYLTTALVLITHRYMESTEDQTRLLREKYEKETKSADENIKRLGNGNTDLKSDEILK